ncbi:hypothetical protein DMB66_46375 [Actinoplanes sp. ATCC 53533]|uniref:hypothetical protein n=1 Tax=Actinoplanes sp. ATCC 53533 TaxID=1288362 RepID=UPI000F7B1A2E|nr:hypothetical protein [Actinoplanes sp. ATCC 53533]RSM48408.1 hypothetical protein DMB66_46375 [Actinoplanes sp. ATCC 53533]
MIRIDGEPQKYYSEAFRQAAELLIAYADGFTAGRAQPSGDGPGGSPSTGSSGTTIAPKGDGLGFATNPGPAAGASPAAAPSPESPKPAGTTPPAAVRTEVERAADDKASAATASAVVPAGIMSICGPIYQAGPALLPVAGEMPSPREIVLVWGPNAYAEVERRLK